MTMGGFLFHFTVAGSSSHLQVVSFVRSKSRAGRLIRILKSLIPNNTYGPYVYGKLKRMERKSLKFFEKISIQVIGV